jgi:predicted glycosyltransferase
MLHRQAAKLQGLLMQRHVFPDQSLHRPDLIFCATGKSGLGHLRRITNVVTAMHLMRPDLRIHLISNAEASGLALGEAKAFAATHLADRREMAAAAALLGPSPVVVDTAFLPGLEATKAPLFLILRETVADKIGAFNLAGGRSWDLVCVPNPAEHWMPAAGAINAKRIAATGWIFRPMPSMSKPQLRVVGGEPSLLVASGGGGNAETAAWFKREVDALLGRVRQLRVAPFRVVQAVGPRMGGDALLAQADQHLDVGPQLNEEFARHDAVISTVGYNSVLELAQTDVPVLLMPITRSFDDQAARAHGWAPAMGHAHDEADGDASALWLADQLGSLKRRAPCALDVRGAETCARLILETLA